MQVLYVHIYSETLLILCTSVYMQLLYSYTIYIYYVAYIYTGKIAYVTGFWKTVPNHT